jgi:uncharacterized membrane protein
VLTQLTGGSGGRRTERQVLANGAVAAAAALVGSWPAVAGALAAATADTWATEIGSFSPTPPRLVTTARRVPAGTSGAVTWLGTAGGLAGASAIAGLAAAFARTGWRSAALVAAAGAGGMLADSLLGATVQGAYECPDCGRRWERGGGWPAGAAACHGPPRLVKGLRWLDNDGVNLAATLAGGGLGALSAGLW